jgi:hypothetical protein
MRRLILAAIIFPGLAYGACLQNVTSSSGQPSLADAARETKKSKQPEQPKAVVLAAANPSMPAIGTPAPADTPPQAPSGLPDLVLQGANNTDDIIQSLEGIKQQRGAAEAEAALHRWYDKHDALLVAALQPREGVKTDNQVAPTLQNVAITLRIQAAFLRIIAEFPKLGFRPEWFKVHCAEGNFAPCR